MKQTESIKENYEFKRVYKRGKSSADANIAVYFFKNYNGYNRLGITVSNKIGKAVIRNKIRRRIKNSFHLNAVNFKNGYDIVIVARTRAVYADQKKLEKSLLRIFKNLGLIGDNNV